MNIELLTQLAEGAVVADPSKYEIMYRKDRLANWKVKGFKNQKAAQAWAEKQEPEVEMRWPSGMQAEESAGSEDAGLAQLSRAQLTDVIIVMERLWRAAKDDSQKAVLKKLMIQYAKALATSDEPATRYR